MIKIKPNLGGKVRLMYIGIGLALIVGSFVVGLQGWQRWSLPVVGIASIATGAVGW